MSSPKSPVKPTGFTDSVNCALEGILYTAKSQKHMRNHFLAALAILAAVLFLRVTSLEFTLLAISVSFVLFAELINTAIEICVDIVSPEYHPLAKTAKDVAAGAVLMAAIGAAIMGYIILSRYIFPVVGEGLGMIGETNEIGVLVAILGVIISAVILKAFAGRGTPLEGGSISGHAAFAFSVATIVALSTKEPVSSLLTFVLAVMISNSRIALNHHSVREVVFGACLGMGLTLAVLLAFSNLP